MEPITFTLTPNTPVSVWGDMEKAMRERGAYGSKLEKFIYRSFECCHRGISLSVVIDTGGDASASPFKE